MRTYSSAGRQYASLARLLNCLVGFMVIAAMGFSAIPSFVVAKGKSRGADKSLKWRAATNASTDHSRGQRSRHTAVSQAAVPKDSADQTNVIAEGRRRRVTNVGQSPEICRVTRSASEIRVVSRPNDPVKPRTKEL